MMPMRVRRCHAEAKVRREKVMVWLGACSSKSLIPLMILDEETVAHSCYIKNELSVALKHGNKVFGDNCTCQQDGVNPHQDHLTQE